MKKKENKIAGFLGNLDVIIACVILAVLIILTALGVVWRYAFNAPFTWLEELQAACLVWIVFAAAGAAFRTGNHVAIEMIVDMLPKKAQKVMEIIISIIVFIVLGYLCIESFPFINMLLKNGRATSMLNIPYALIYGIAILSYVDMIISYFYSIRKGVKSEVKEVASSNE